VKLDSFLLSVSSGYLHACEGAKGREGKRWMNDMHANVRGEKRMDSHVHALNFKIKRS